MSVVQLLEKENKNLKEKKKKKKKKQTNKQKIFVLYCFLLMLETIYLMVLIYILHFNVFFFNIFNTLSSSISICAGFRLQAISKFYCAQILTVSIGSVICLFLFCPILDKRRL